MTLDRLLKLAFVAAWALILGSVAVNAAPRHSSAATVNPFSPWYWTNSGNGNGRNGWAQDMLSRPPSAPVGFAGAGSAPHGARRTGVAPYAPPSGIVRLSEPAPPNACGPGRFELIAPAPGEPMCVGKPGPALAP